MRQNTVETSTFGSECIAMKTAVEQIEALRYKIRMFGSPIEGPTNVFCDNEAVFKNASMPNLTLRKKHTSICYHRCHEAVASGTVRIAKEGTLTNLCRFIYKAIGAGGSGRIARSLHILMSHLLVFCVHGSRGPNESRA